MAIRSFEYANESTGWSLERVDFGPLNLLVGHSGVGKTRIIDALGDVLRAAAPKAERVPVGCRWSIDVAVDGHVYRWAAETGAARANGPDRDWGLGAGRPAGAFLGERIHRDDGLLVERSDAGFTFEGRELPKLSTDESAVVLLREDPAIAPLYAALHRCMFRHARPEPGEHGPLELVWVVHEPRDEDPAPSLEELRARTSLSRLRRADLMRRGAPEAFAALSAQYRAIFPMVRAVTVAPMAELRDDERAGPRVDIAIKEQGIDDWIIGPRISSGMRKTFWLLLDLALAPDDSVLIVDEFENSLGVNCLGPVTDALTERVGDIQFILTSHHPYIIENVPTRYWKIVTREGGRVTVLDADQVPALRTKSSQSSFLQLLNSAEYKGGIAG